MNIGSLIADVSGAVDSVFRRTTPAQWQAAKQRPTQYGDNKNRPSPTRAEVESDMERDRR